MSRRNLARPYADGTPFYGGRRRRPPERSLGSSVAIAIVFLLITNFTIAGWIVAVWVTAAPFARWLMRSGW